MKKIIYIHIGSPKTGTTSIQQFLTINTKALLSEGLFYPIVGRKYTESELLSLNKCGNNVVRNTTLTEDAPLVCMNGSVLTKNGYDMSSFGELLNRFSSSESPAMLLSEEVLFIEHQDNICDRVNLFQSLSEYEVKIIIYLKRSVEYLSGLWQEEIRNGSTISLENYLESHNYAGCLQIIHDLAKKVGNENIIVRTFEKESWVNGNLIDDFLSIFNIKNSSRFEKLKGGNNIGLSREKSEMHRYINQYLDIVIERNDYGINQKIPEGHNSQKIMDSLPDDTIKRVSDKYYLYECEIAREFLEKEELFSHRYPLIYKSKRDYYVNKISEGDRVELQFIIKTILQKKIIDRQEVTIGLVRGTLKTGQSFLVEKKQDKAPTNVSLAGESQARKILVHILCSFVPLKEYRRKIRRYFLE